MRMLCSKGNEAVSIQHEPDPESLFCPKCGSTDVRRSRGDGPLAFFNGLFGRLPYRCRSCRGKFYRHAPGEQDSETRETTEHREQTEQHEPEHRDAAEHREP